MKCKEASNLFLEHRLGTISQENKQALEEHLNHCQSCQKAWETYSLFLSDAQIEDDFPIPSQLNAKIKYTIHQAKNKKKVPFFRSKQVLSYATACCFLLVAGIWGTTHFEQIKEDIQTPLLATETHIEQPVETETENREQEIPVADSTTSQPEPLSNQPVEKTTPKPAPVQYQALQSDVGQTEATTSAAEPLADQTSTITEDYNSVDVANDVTEPVNPAVFSRQIDSSVAIGEYPADISVNTQFQAALLEGYPHTKLTDTVYSITITKAELEEILQKETTLEEKSEYIIEFNDEN